MHENVNGVANSGRKFVIIAGKKLETSMATAAWQWGKNPC
jgi:hypothetical protein